MDWPGRLLTLVTALLVLVLAGCAEEQLADVPRSGSSPETVGENVATQRPAETGDFGGAVTVQDQVSDGTSVVIERAAIDGNERGWVAVYDDVHNSRGEVIGTAPLKAAGALEDATVELDRTLEGPRTTLWAVVHVDADPVGEFNPGRDAIVANNGDTVEQSFTVTVEP